MRYLIAGGSLRTLPDRKRKNPNKKRDATIMKLIKSGIKHTEIAKKYNLTPSRINGIFRRETHLPNRYNKK